MAALVSCLALVWAEALQAQTEATSPQSAPPTTSTDASFDDLIRVLENETSRKALIEQLKNLDNADISPPTTGPEGGDSSTEPTTTDQNVASEPEATPAPLLSVTRQLAVVTQSLSEDTFGLLRQFYDAFTSIIIVFSGGTPVDWDRFTSNVTSIGLVALVTIVTYILTRTLAYRILAFTERKASLMGLRGRFLLKLGWTFLDAILILTSWSIGYLAAMRLSGSVEINIQHALFLNAFLASELFAVGLRAVFSARSSALRPFPLTDETAKYWQFWLARLAELVIYGLFLVVPVVSIDLSFVGAQSLRVLLVAMIALIAIFIVLRGRRSVRRGIKRIAQRLGIPVVSTLLTWIGNIWHLIAILYILSSTVIWLTRPFGAVRFVIEATVSSLVGFLLAVLTAALLTRLLQRGIRLPSEWQESAPYLQRRLNRFVPFLIRTVRTAIFFGVLIWIVDAWNLMDVSGWIATPGGQNAVGRVFAALLTLLVAFLLHTAVMAWIESRLSEAMGRSPTARERTLLTLFQNAFTIALVVVAFLLALSELNINIAPFLAGAGVLGLAIGFGSQKLVQDIITGAFIQIENAMNEGDVVTISGVSGVVERLTIRSVGLRDLDGVYHLIPFSSVDQVANYMRGFAYHVANIGVAYREDIDQVKQLMHQAFDELREEEIGLDIIGALEMHGVTELADSAVVVRARIKTKPGYQWAIGRAYNEKIKSIFDANSIEIPYPHMTLYWGEDKEGSAPPLHVLQAKRQKPLQTSNPSAESHNSTPNQIANTWDIQQDIPENED